MHKEIQVPVQVENISYPQCFLLFSWVSICLYLFKIQMHKDSFREWGSGWFIL